MILQRVADPLLGDSEPGCDRYVSYLNSLGLRINRKQNLGSRRKLSVAPGRMAPYGDLIRVTRSRPDGQRRAVQDAAREREM